jgi:hypothetical protein
MTRTEYANTLRAAGFTVRPVWQGKTEDPEGPRFDLTCYEVHARTPGGVPGEYVTQMIVRDLETGLDVFFASPSIRAADDIRFLREIAERKAAAA